MRVSRTGGTFAQARATFSTGVGAAGWMLPKGKGQVFSPQGAARIPGKRRENDPAQFGTSLRGGFLIVEGGYRLRSGDPPDAFRTDVTLGYRPASRLRLPGSICNAVSNGRGRGIFGQRYRDALRERCVFTGIRFRLGERSNANPDC